MIGDRPRLIFVKAEIPTPLRHLPRSRGFLLATVSSAVIASLSRSMLFKSMTTHADHRVWQDVYHAPCPNGKTAYIKLTMQDGAVVIQFKEK